MSDSSADHTENKRDCSTWAVTAFKTRSRSAFICSRPTMRSFRAVWNSPARRSRSRPISMIRVERAATIGSRVSVLPLPRNRFVNGVGA